MNVISNDTLIMNVSCIGFASQSIRWLPATSADSLNIYLTPNLITLNELLITSDRTTPQEIIAEAYSRISENYRLEEHLLTGYFKESENTDEGPLYIAEALIQAKIPSQGADADAGIEIIHLTDRKWQLPDINKEKLPYRTGGAYRCLKNSINDPIDPIFPSQFPNYEYAIVGYTSYNGRNVVIISFTDSKRKPIFGKLIIDLESYAFMRMEGTKTHGDGSPLDTWKWTQHTWIEEYIPDGSNKWVLNSSIYIGDWIRKRNRFYWIKAERNKKFQTKSFYYTTSYSQRNTFSEKGIEFKRSEKFYFREFSNNADLWKNFELIQSKVAEERIQRKVH